MIITSIGLRLYYNDDRIRTIAEQKIGESVNSDAHIGFLKVHGFVVIELRDIELKDRSADSAWFTLSDCRVAIDPSRLLKGELELREIMGENARYNYALMPALETSKGKSGKSSGPFSLPLTLNVPDVHLTDLTIYGPEADLNLDFELKDTRFKDLRNFSTTYSLSASRGTIHYKKGEYSVAGNCNILCSGEVSSNNKCNQELRIVLNDLAISAPKPVAVNEIKLTAITTFYPGEQRLGVDALSVAAGKENLIKFTGDIGLEAGPRIALQANEQTWNLSEVNSILKGLGFPLNLSGDVKLTELKIGGKPPDLNYQFSLNLSDVGIEYNKQLFLKGLEGSIYSDGEKSLLVFGSSLRADSLTGYSDNTQLFGVHGISAAVEAELAGSDIDFNVSADAADFFGGEFDISAFSQNSKVDGELKIDDVRLSEAVSGLLADQGVGMNGIFNLLINISGDLDSIQSNVSANMEDFTIRFEGDSLYIPRQDFDLTGLTKIGNDNINSNFDYHFPKSISGRAELSYPLRSSPLDSIVMSYRMNLDNSVLPSYLPAEILKALGAVEIAGGSVIDGRFASASDSLNFRGSSKLTIEPTDIMIGDLQSILYSLISVSELEVSDRGISLFSNSGIEDLVNENYSDLDFSGITLEAEIVSTSDTTWRITYMNATIPSMKTSVSVLGDFGYSGKSSYSNLTMVLEFDSGQPVTLGNEFSAAGNLRVTARTAGRDTLFEFTGSADFDKLEVESGEILKCGDISGKLPFSGKIDLADSMFIVQMTAQDFPASSYQRVRAAGLSSDKFGHIRIGYLQADPVYITDINLDAGFSDGALDIPYLTGNLLGGDFYGVLRVDLGNVNLMREIPNYEAMNYKLDLELSSLDFNRLIEGTGPFKSKADFGADAHFVGNGIIAPGEIYSISGSFHITKMGPGVAERVLDVLDPENSNPSIVQTRELLNRKVLGIIDMSYKPKNFSFELKHGSLYPRLYMDQPFFADVLPIIRIPMPIEYGRIPVKSLLDNLKEETW